MLLDSWAAAWGVSPAALADLAVRLAGTAPPPGVAKGAEGWSQSHVRLLAAERGVWLTRNNVGALVDARGVPVRYGLANESKAQNAAVKSADLIGIDASPIRPEDVGQPRGRFVSIEAKRPGWRYTGAGRELAQLQWAAFVTARGGLAGFSTGEWPW